MAAILNLPKISRYDRNNATLLKLHGVAEGHCCNVSAKNWMVKYNRKLKNKTFNFQKISISYFSTSHDTVAVHIHPLLGQLYSAMQPRLCDGLPTLFCNAAATESGTALT